MADTRSNIQDTSNRPRFSAGLITALVTAVFLIAFALITVYGTKGVQHHDNLIASEAE